MDELKKYYYSEQGYQQGKTAAKKLKLKFPKLKVQEIQHWLNRQPIYQIYKKPPKSVKYPHYTQDQPNHTHQVDILYLPHDKKFKYALTVIDIASRYKEAQPLKSKKASETAKAIAEIYERSPLNYPKVIMADYGNEFFGEFLQQAKKHETKIHRSLNKKKVAFVERFNKTLSEKLFAHQYAQEMATSSRNTEWVVRLPGVIEALNNEETRMIGMKPIDAIVKESVPQPDYEEVPEVLPINSLVRYLYKPGEAEGDNKYRATDPIWSVDVYEIEEIKEFDDQPAIYELRDIENRSFTKEQLQVVPEDTEH